MLFLFKVSIVAFMVGTFFQLGLELNLRAAIAGLGNIRFMALGALFGFVLGPLLAWFIAIVLALDAPYAIGLILLAFTPCAPFLPMMVKRAHGELDHVPAMMLLGALGAVILLPPVVPLLVPGADADMIAIASPLVVAMALPMVAGVFLVMASRTAATLLLRFVKPLVGLVTGILLVLCLVIYGSDFLAAVGTYAVFAQFLFLGTISATAHFLRSSLDQDRKTVLVLGMCTRNVGAALAPLYAVPGIDPQAIVMVVLAVPIQLICAFIASSLLGRDSQRRTL